MAKKEDKPESSITDILKDINSQWNSSVKFMGDVDEDLKVISTGSIALNRALGTGGYPAARVTEIRGWESSGKSTLCLNAVAAVQKSGGNVAYIDVEHALDPKYMRRIGVKLEELALCQPDSAEQALNVLVDLIKTNKFRLIIVDSVAALVSQAELNGDLGDSHIGILARLMSDCLKKINPLLKSNDTTVIFVNQFRKTINTGGFGGGSGNTTPGGNALKFYAAVILEVARVQTLKNSEESVANRTKVTVKKNKHGSPFTTAEFDIVFGEGISRSGELIDFGIETGIVRKSGSWYVSDVGDLKCQGKEAARHFIDSNPDVADALEKIILEKLDEEKNEG